MAAKIETTERYQVKASRSLQQKGIAIVPFLMLALVAFESLVEGDTEILYRVHDLQRRLISFTLFARQHSFMVPAWAGLLREWVSLSRPPIY